MGVSKSTDAGMTWTHWDVTSVYGYVNAIAIDPTNTDIVYSCGYPNVYKTTDGGSTWNEMLPGLSSTLYDIAVDPVTPTVVYAGRYNGLFKSTDGGANWSAIGPNTSTTYAILIDPDDHTTVYIGARDGVWKWTDSERAWTQMNDGLEDTYVTSLGLYIDNYIYAATNAGGMYRWEIIVGAEEQAEQQRPCISFAHPNPARDQIAIYYQLHQDASVHLAIYDIQGRLVKILLSQNQNAGIHTTHWNGTDSKNTQVAAGVYFYKLMIDNQTYMQKVTLLR